MFLSLSFIIGLLFEILKRLKKIEQRMEKEDETQKPKEENSR